MKKLITTALFTLVSVFSFSQQISVRVTELKDFVSNEKLTPDEIFKVANFDSDVRTVDGSYLFDLASKTVEFKTRKSSGTGKIISSSEKNGIYTIVIEELNGVGNRMYITMVVDTVKNNVFYTHHDPINNYTLAQQFTETEIKVKK
jgi:hypothetical protein